MRKTGVMACVLAGWMAMAPPPAQARSETGCFEGFLNCAEFAWSLDGLWDRIVMATLCDQVFKECVREKLIGF